jgi:hypothetical protein
VCKPAERREIIDFGRKVLGSCGNQKIKKVDEPIFSLHFSATIIFGCGLSLYSE